MTLVFEHLHVKPATKLVALVLADHANGDGLCWPSYRRIADWTGMDKRTIQRHVKTLIELGVVTKLRTGHLVKHGGKVIRVSNAYKMHEDRLVELSPADLWMGDSFVTPERDNRVASRGGQLSTKPLLNPHSYNHHLCANVDNQDQAALDAAFDQLLDEDSGE
jgi:hypothetical protein